MADRGKKSAVYGSLVNARGQGAMVEVLPPRGLDDRAGYSPEALDPIIATLLRNASDGAQLVAAQGPMLMALMQRVQHEIGVLLEMTKPSEVQVVEGEVSKPAISEALACLLPLADKASIILDRLNKMTLNAAKTVDDASRLRTFLATGDEDDGGLKGMSESQLRQLINDAAQGWQKPEPESNA